MHCCSVEDGGSKRAALPCGGWWQAVKAKAGRTVAHVAGVVAGLEAWEADAPSILSWALQWQKAPR